MACMINLKGRGRHMDVLDCAGIITSEMQNLLQNVDTDRINHVLQAMDKARRIFCGATGRSGYVMQCFSMRLMHLGYPAFFVGDTTTPPIGRKDLLIVLSGSGETPWTYAMVKKAKESGALVCAILGLPDSPISPCTDYVICLPAGSKAKPLSGPFQSEQPVGSLFEQAAFLLLESVVLALYKSQGSQAQALLTRHANLE